MTSELNLAELEVFKETSRHGDVLDDKALAKCAEVNTFVVDQFYYNHMALWAGLFRQLTKLEYVGRSDDGVVVLKSFKIIKPFADCDGAIFPEQTIVYSEGDPVTTMTMLARYKEHVKIDMKATLGA